MAVSSVYDAFISFAPADRAWVEGYLQDALESGGVSVLTEEAFELGHPRLTEFERAVTQSRRVVLVLSPAYLVDETAGFVDLMAQTYGMDTATWPVIPMLVEPVTLPARLAMLRPLDATDPAGWEAAISQLTMALSGMPPPPTPIPACPYPGMEPFTTDQSPLFHGREAETADLVQRLHAQRTASQHFLAVIGPSGSGKSSLVFAGLVPALLQSRLFGTESWQVVSLRPGASPLTTLTSVVGTDFLWEGEGQAGLRRPRLLIIDQFEELFTLGIENQRDDFATALARLAEMPDNWVVLTVRADFYPELMASHLWPLIQGHRVEVLPLDEAGLRQAIVRPAERAEVHRDGVVVDRVAVYVEGALVERLVADAAGEPGVLPLVQQTLVLLWEKLERRFLPLRAYEALVLPRRAYGEVGPTGRTGLEVAVARHADAVLNDLSPAQQVIARRIFLRLIQFGLGRADTRRQRPVKELRAQGDDPALVDSTLEHLASHRLLTLSGEEQGGTRRADLAHEALIGGWPWLQRLISERREAELTRQRLEDKTVEWERLGRGRGGLLDDAELAEAERWLGGPDAAELGVSTALPALATASRVELEREERQLRRRLYGAVAFALLALVAAILAFSQFREAEENADRAQSSEDIAIIREAEAVAAQATAEWQASVSQVRALAAQAQVNQEHNDDERGALLAVEAYRLNIANGGDAHVQVDEALRTVLSQDHFSIRLETGLNVPGIAISADASLLAIAPPAISLVGSPDQSVRLWNLDAPHSTLAILQGNVRVADMALSQDGSIFAAVTRDGSLRGWNLAVPDAEPVILGESVNALEGDMKRIALSPDGGHLAMGGGKILDVNTEPTLWVWDMTQPDAAAAVFNFRGTVFSLGFSSDGSKLAVGSNDGTIWLWDPTQPDDEPVVLYGHRGPVQSLAFSPSGSMLASGSDDTTIRIWDLSRPDGDPVLLEGLDGSTTALAFSPGGDILASGGIDGEVRLWNVTEPTSAPTILRGHTLVVGAMGFSTDGSRLVTGSGDGTVRLWEMDLADGAPLVIEDGTFPTALAFSTDGAYMASAVAESTGRPVRLWDLTWPDAELEVLSSQTVVIHVLVFSPDGNVLASGGIDGTIQIWDLTRPNVNPIVFQGHEEAILALVFSEEDRVLLSGSSDGEVRSWDLSQSSFEPVTLIDQDDATAVAFNSRGSMVAMAGKKGELRVWDLSQPNADPAILPSDLQDSGDYHMSLAFHPDNKILASGGTDGAIRLWNLGQLDAEPMVLSSHEGFVRTVTFDSHGSLLASGSEDGTVRIWEWGSAQHDPIVLRDHEGPVVAVAFNPDAHTLATASGEDGTTRFWIPQTQKLVEMACNKVQRNLTLEEWERFIGESIPYRQTCPNLPPGEGAPGARPTPTDDSEGLTFRPAREIM